MPWDHRAMSGSEGADARLGEARIAVAHRAWERALELLSALDSESGLEPEDLEALAKAAYWTGDSDRSIATREKAYAAYIARGDEQRAAFCALTLRREYISKLQHSVATGWLTRAERLLDQLSRIHPLTDTSRSPMPTRLGRAATSPRLSRSSIAPWRSPTVRVTAICAPGARCGAACS